MKCFEKVSFKNTFIVFLSFLFSSYAYAVSFPDAGTMLQNISNQVPQITKLVTALAYVMGFFFTYKGLIELKKFGEQRSMMGGEHHIAGPLLYLFVGAMLIYFPSSVRVGLDTFWTEYTPYSYSTRSADPWTMMKNSVYLIVQLVGVISFIRGLVLLTSLGGQQGGQPGTFGRALAHIIAGIMCINLHGFVMMMSATLGITW